MCNGRQNDLYADMHCMFVSEGRDEKARTDANLSISLFSSKNFNFCFYCNSVLDGHKTLRVFTEINCST